MSAAATRVPRRYPQSIPRILVVPDPPVEDRFASAHIEFCPSGFHEHRTLGQFRPIEQPARGPHIEVGVGKRHIVGAADQCLGRIFGVVDDADVADIIGRIWRCSPVALQLLASLASSTDRSMSQPHCAAARTRDCLALSVDRGNLWPQIDGRLAGSREIARRPGSPPRGLPDLLRPNRRRSSCSSGTPARGWVILR